MLQYLPLIQVLQRHWRHPPFNQMVRRTSEKPHD
jgi:hypothetical protein